VNKLLPSASVFSFLIKEIFSQSSLFTGWPSHVVPMHNMEAVSKKKLVVIGKMLATCVAQGGVAPLCFARAVADYFSLW
jgi:hypothetical protein